MPEPQPGAERELIGARRAEPGPLASSVNHLSCAQRARLDLVSETVTSSLRTAPCHPDAR